MSASHHPNIQGLIELARRDGVDIRPTLLRVLADLYVQQAAHNANEQSRFTELACRLLDGVDAATRVAVAERLARYAGTPAAVAARLARDEIAVAAPVLRLSPALGEAELHAILDRMGPAHATAIAARVGLPRSVAERLRGLTRATAEKALALLDEIRTASVLDGENAASPPLAPAQPGGPSQKAALARRYLDADADERRRIAAELENRAPLEPADLPPSADPALSERLEQAALRHRPQEFAALLDHALGIPPALAARIVADPSGEPLVAIFRAIGLPFELAARILFFLNPNIGRSVQRVLALAEFYETMGNSAAQRLAAAWRSSPPAHYTPHPGHSAREGGEECSPRSPEARSDFSPMESAARRAASNGS
jgi:uncharacterized protein (DUF2336 family)